MEPLTAPACVWLAVRRSAATDNSSDVDLEAQVEMFMKKQAEIESGGKRGRGRLQGAGLAGAARFALRCVGWLTAFAAIPLHACRSGFCADEEPGRRDRRRSRQQRGGDWVRGWAPGGLLLCGWLARIEWRTVRCATHSTCMPTVALPMRAPPPFSVGVVLCMQLAQQYCRDVFEGLKTLKRTRDMSLNEVKLIVMIEDPRAREMRAQGIEVGNGNMRATRDAEGVGKAAHARATPLAPHPPKHLALATRALQQPEYRLLCQFCR